MVEQEKNELPCPRIVGEQQELTAEQYAYACHFSQERIASMFSTAEIDEAEAEAHLRQVYHLSGLNPPRIRWFDSPMAFLLAYAPPELWENMVRSIWESLEDSVWETLRADLGTRVDNTIFEVLEGGVGVNARKWMHRWFSDVWPSTWESMETDLEAGVWDGLKTRVDESVPAYLEDRVEEGVGYGEGAVTVLAYYQESLLAFYYFLHEVFEPNTFSYLARFNEMVSGYYLGREEAWLVRKPTRLHCNEQGRLHSVEGMCLCYRDGWGFFAWHGVRVPEKVILHPEYLTKEDWLRELNREVRRVMQERWGHERFIETIGATCIDRSLRGELVEVDLGNDPEGVAHYIHVKDSSTQQQYYLRVPPWIRRADEAIAWTFGLNEQDYQPITET